MHKENGLCSEHELLKILETVGPDVVFEEIRPADFDSYYRDRSRSRLETRAVIRYLKVRSAQQVPVDDYVIPESFPRDIASLDEYVGSNSIEYCELMDEIDQKTHLLGFRYLSSSEFEALNKRASESYEKSIAISSSEDLKNRLSMLNDQLRKRDASMVEKIYDFCRNNQFTEGVFLVGAGHKSSIVEDIENRMKTEANLVDWNIWNGAAAQQIVAPDAAPRRR